VDGSVTLHPRTWVSLVILTVPVGNVLVRDPGGHVKHDDTALAVDVISITKSTELLLTSSIPNIELDLAKVLGRWLVCEAWCDQARQRHLLS
jgi:hypothetical protein